MFDEYDESASDKPRQSPDPSESPQKIKEKVQAMVKHCAAYQTPHNGKALFQAINTFVPFFLVCGVMIYNFSTAYWITAMLTPLASLLLVRLFIIQHDCGHGSFFSSRKWNNRVGRFISLLTWTPYDFWRKTHNMHHSASGNLDNRGFGAIETITVEEYNALPPNVQFWYRLYRNPYVLLLLGTPFFILVLQRFTITKPFPFCEIRKSIEPRHVRSSVLGLNMSLLCVYGALGLVFGFAPILLSYLPVVVGTAWIGGWLFFIQHQFEDAHWSRQNNWDYHEAAVMGSSHYDLHPIMHWFTGNIGLHHIHHLNAKIPNYRLHECMNADKNLQNLNKIKLFDSFAFANLALWDEAAQKMITFKMHNA